MSRRIRYGKYAEPSLSGMTLRPSLERIIMRYASVGFTAFLTALLAFSIFTPVELTDATEVLSALDINNGSISIATASNTVDLSLTAGSAGAVRTASDTVTVTAGSTGYQLYIGTSGTNNALIRDGTTGANASDTIPASSITNISSPDVLSNDTWGFAVASSDTSSTSSGSYDVVSTGFDPASSYPVGDNSVATSKFIAVPTHGNDVLVAKRTTATPSGGIPTNFYYGIRATAAKPSGLYRNTVTYTAIGDSSVENLASVSPSRTSKISGGETLTIATPSTTALSSIASDGLNVTVGGMTCTGPVASKNNALTIITCTAPALATGWHEVVANITTTAGNTETYIVNPGIEYYTEDGIMAMQDFTQNMCMEMNVLDTITLIDNRDDNTYKVTRQRDGNCWMVQNLRLGNSVFGTSDTLTLTSADSDVTSDFTITNDIFNSGSDTESWSDPVDTKHIYTYKDTENEVAYGNLYNWYTATAGTGTTSLSSATAATSSICPKGWNLPNHSGNGSFQALTLSTIKKSDGSMIGTTHSSSHASPYAPQFMQAPLSFSISEFYDSGLNHNGAGRWWTKNSYTNAASLGFLLYTSGNFNSANAFPKYQGEAIRCAIATPTMQDFTSTICTNLETAKTLTLVDNRDYNDYKVTKQADNNCWMTQNLRLGTINTGTGIQNVTLTTANTDLTSGTANKTLVVLGSGESLSDRIQTSANPTGSWADPVDAYHVYSFAGTSNATTYGNLYNWYTATAASGTTSVTNGSDASMSICPANWKLPPSTGTGSYATLIQTQIPNIPTSSNAGTTGKSYTSQFVQTPLFFVFSGLYSSSNSAQNANSRYWSRTTYVTDQAYQFFFDTGGSFYLRISGTRTYGLAVRCVFIPS